MSIFRHWAVLVASACVLALPGRGQVTATAGFGTGGSIAATGMAGAQTITIPANVGQQRGGNLFHSFTQFDVGAGDTAKFTDTGLTMPMTINNIIARVYSATPSMIDGHILVDASGHLASANLFLINPNGVVFGANSSVSVPGDFVVSTANYTMLSDGTGVFYSDPTNASSKTDNLTAAPVSAFGFFQGTTPAGITVNGGANFLVGGSLQFATGSFLAGPGANLSVANGVLGIFSGGQTSASADGSVPYLNGTTHDYSSAANFAQYGNVTLGGAATGATLSATGTGGAVVIRGGRLVQQGAGASLSASGRVAIQAGSFNLSGTVSTGTGTIGIDTAGDIAMTGGTITAAGGSIALGRNSLVNLTLDSASAITETAGSGGMLTINTSGAITNGGTISASGTNSLQISAASLGLTGTISTMAGTLGIDTTGAVTLTGGTITSQGGSITLGQTSLGNLTLDRASMIDSAGGMITVIARGDIGLSGPIESTTNGSGNAGNVNITDTAGNITLDSGAEIASIAGGMASGNAGNVTINGGVTATNSAKTLTITGTGVAGPNTGIFSLSNGTGDAGSVNVVALGSVALSSGGQIASVATNLGGGNAGTVTLSLNADPSTLTIGGVSANATTVVPIIYSSTANAARSDGAVHIYSLLADVELQSGAAIQTSAQDTTAGNIIVEASSLTLDPYSAIQSLMSQVSKNDTSTSGATGNVLAIVLNPRVYPFTGPLSIADNAFIQTVANPNKKTFNPLGQVTVFAGSLTEGGMSVPTAADGYDFSYVISGHTQIRMQNATSVNSPNGSDSSNNAKPIVENLSGYPNTSNGMMLPTPPPGDGIVLDDTLDGSLGYTVAPVVPTLSGLTYIYTITPTDGTLAGNNLFLSFSDFTLGINHPDSGDPSKVGPVSEEAIFDAPGVNNIVARVTGGSASQINGQLAEASGTTANLFFLNPGGIMFTTNSSLNLQGALTLSTANSVQLGGVGTFLTQANALSDMLLTSAPALFSGPVTGFGFTATTPAAISFDTAMLSNDASTNSQIQVIAGDITLDGGSILNASQTLLFSAGGPGTLTFPSAGGSLATFSPSFSSASQVLDDASFAALGTVTLSNDSVLTVPSPNIASTILIRANAFNLDDSIIVDQTTADTGSLGGKVLIDVTGAASITSTNNSSTISTSTLGASDAGAVQINAASLTITGDPNDVFTAGILSTAQPANYYTSDSGFVAFTYTDPATATGNAGSVTLDIGGAITLSTFAQISTNTNGLGTAGTITIAGLNGVHPQLTISGGSSITSSTSLDNPAFTQTGNAGTVVATLSSFSMTGFPSMISTSAGTPTNTAGPTGDGGNVNLTVTGQAGAGNGDFTISNGAFISASSFNNGKGGTVVVNQTNAPDGIVIDGEGASPATGTGTGIFAAEFGDGSSSGLGVTPEATTPAINLITDATIMLTGGGEISTSAAGNGNAGPVRVVSGSLTIDGTGAAASETTGILSSSTGSVHTGTNPNATGNGGDITLNVTGDLSVINGGAISASSDTVGEAGTVTINQSGSTEVVDPATNPAVNGGIYVNGGSISTAANGIGTANPASASAGDITLHTQALTLDDGTIVSSTLGLSKGGNITVNGVSSGQPAQFVVVKDGSEIASNTGGAGDGGTISILTGALTLNGAGSAISTNATAGTGGGGGIGVTVAGNAAVVGATGDVAITDGGAISALSETSGEAGTVTITQSGSTDLATNPAGDGGLYLDDGLISTAANGTGTASPASARAGNIALNAQAVTATGGSLILSSTAGLSKAGDVTIGGAVAGTDTEFVEMEDGARIASETGGANGSGSGGTITIGAESLAVNDAGISTSTTGGVGEAGDILIRTVPAGAVTLANGGTIVSESADSGAAGMIGITTGRLTVTDAGSSISTDAGSVGRAGNAKGEIVLTGTDFNLANDGVISATTGGLSPGGTITIKASDAVMLSMGAELDASSTSGTSGGNGGSILIGNDPTGVAAGYGVTSPLLVSLTGHAQISCDSQNTNGGNISITTEQLTSDESVISTNEPNGAATTLGGDITIKAGNVFYLNHYSFVDSNAGKGTGGNIIIDPEFAVLNHSGISAAGGAANGNVTIDATYVLAGTSFIVATGTVDIDSLPLDLTGSLVPLPADLTNEENRLREKCARAVNHEFSSFILVGRGGTEDGPNELQPDFGL